MHKLLFTNDISDRSWRQKRKQLVKEEERKVARRMWDRQTESTRVGRLEGWLVVLCCLCGYGRTVSPD